jgi:hypothetical protein
VERRPSLLTCALAAAIAIALAVDAWLAWRPQ